MVEENPDQPRRPLTPGEIKFNERVTAAQQLARQMELAIRPGITPEELERLAEPRNNKDGEIGYSWSYLTTVEGRPAVGCVELEVRSHGDLIDAFPTGDVTLSITRGAYMQDDRSQALGGLCWAQTIDKDAEAEDIFRKAGKELSSAWDEVKELASKLPEIARKRKTEVERLMRKQGLKQTADGWAREDSN